MKLPGYNVDHLGEFEHLSHFQSFISKKPVQGGSHQVYIEIDEPSAEAAQSRHPFICSVLSNLDVLARDAKEALRQAHNPTDEELDALTLNGLLFESESDFELRYLLPEGEAVEYLSVKFCARDDGFRILETSFGNF